MAEDRKWFRVSLRLSGPTVPVDELNERLSLVASYVGRKGEHIRGNPKYAKHEASIWVWAFTKDDTVAFEEQLEQLLEVLEPKQRALEWILRHPGAEGELFLGYSSDCGQGGAYLSSALLARISSLGLALSLDLYPPGGGEDVEP